MKNQFLTFFLRSMMLFLIASTPFALRAMEEGSYQEKNSKSSQGDKLFPIKEFQSPTKATAFSTNDNKCEFDPFLISLEKAKEGDSIRSMQFRFTSSPLNNTLKRKAEQGVDVEIIIDGKDENTKKKAKILQKSGAKILVFEDPKITLHEKTTLWTITQPNGTKEVRTRSGSQNATTQATKGGNLEIIAYDPDPEIYNSALEQFKKIEKHSIELGSSTKENPSSPLKTMGNSELQLTPEKKLRITSLQNDINKTNNVRFKNADKELWVNFYTIDYKNMPELIKAASRGVLRQLNVDSTSLNSPCVSRDLFRCAALGANVFIFNPNQTKKFADKFALINHVKAYVRENQDGSILTAIGTQNLTASNNADINSEVLYPDDREMAQKVKQIIVEIGNESKDITSLNNYKEIAPLADLDARITFLSQGIKRDEANKKFDAKKYTANIKKCNEDMDKLEKSVFFKQPKNKDAYSGYYYQVRTNISYLSGKLNYKHTKLD